MILKKNDQRVFDVNKAMKKYNKQIDWRKIEQGPKMDDVKDMRADHYSQQKKSIGMASFLSGY
jgi:hypothetical protein